MESMRRQGTTSGGGSDRIARTVNADLGYTIEVRLLRDENMARRERRQALRELRRAMRALPFWEV